MYIGKHMTLNLKEIISFAICRVRLTDINVEPHNTLQRPPKL